MAPDLKGYEAWLKRRDLQPETIMAYVESVRFAYSKGSPVSVLAKAKSLGRRQQLRSALNQYARFVGDEDLLAAVEAIPKPRNKRRVPERPLNSEEWHSLLAAVHDEEEPVQQALALIVLTGLRSSDVSNIERDRVEESLKTSVLYLQQKGGHYRPFPVEGLVKENLQELVAGWEDWDRLHEILTTGKSHRAAYMVIYRKMKAAADRAGLDVKRVHPHLLRITAAADLYRRTKDIHAVQQFLGHANISTTEGYLKYVNPDNLMDSMRALMASREE
jgi:site-specific recombinase XerC